MKPAKYIAKLAAVFVGGTALFFFLLVLIFCIPNRLVIEKQQESLSLFDENGDVHEYPFTREEIGWNWIFTHARGSQLDNATDYTMILNVTPDSADASVLYQAMDCNDYARYWHGYLVFLRPLMMLFSYLQIRYLYMFLYMLLGASIVMRLSKRFGNRMAYLWTLCACFVYPVVLPFSLQFSSVFFIMMAAILVVDRLYKGYDWQQAGVFFLIIGMLTSYLDFFTAPLLTLGVPLIWLMLLNYERYQKDSLKKNLFSLLTASVTWVFGYFGCWCMKWMIATPILGRNVVQEGIGSMLRRTVETYHTSTGYDTGSLRAVAMNLFAILPPGITSADWKWFLGGILAVVLVLAVIFAKLHTDRKGLVALTPFLFVALYPFAWFIVVSQHTSIHYLFTYRIELISLLGFCIFYGKAIKKL